MPALCRRTPGNGRTTLIETSLLDRKFHSERLGRRNFGVYSFMRFEHNIQRTTTSTGITRTIAQWDGTEQESKGKWMKQR